MTDNQKFVEQVRTRPNELRGTVTAINFSQATIDCPDAPEWLKVLHVRNYLTGNLRAKVGDRVRLAYWTTPGSGYWVIAEILR